MEIEITASLIEGVSTIIASGLIATLVYLYSDKNKKLKEKLNKASEDCEFWYKIEEALIDEITINNGDLKALTIKKVIRQKVRSELGRDINYKGITKINNLKTK
jgi:hypothetical protein